MSHFENVEYALPGEGFTLEKQYNDDRSMKKVNLGLREYKDEYGKPWVLPVVRRAEKEFSNCSDIHKEVLSSVGLETFCQEAIKLLLGDDCVAVSEGRCFGIQCIGGSCGLNIGGKFLTQILNRKFFYCSKPTKGNHMVIFRSAGFEAGGTYRYVSKSSLRFEDMLEDLMKAPEGSVIVFQTCGHVPTGCDPTKEQWIQIAAVVKERGLFPFFDCSCQGLASGDLAEDAWSVRYFVQQGLELFCVQSFSEIFGIPNERVGNLVVVVNDAGVIENMRSQFMLLIKWMFSSPTIHGARIVARILTHLNLFDQWTENLKLMCDRMVKMRKELRNVLECLETPGDWSHITKQTGLYCCTGLNEVQSEHMLRFYHIYMSRSGYVNMGGINEGNVDYIAKAIYETVTALPDKIQM